MAEEPWFVAGIRRIIEVGDTGISQSDDDFDALPASDEEWREAMFREAVVDAGFGAAFLRHVEALLTSCVSRGEEDATAQEAGPRSARSAREHADAPAACSGDDLANTSENQRCTSPSPKVGGKGGSAVERDVRPESRLDVERGLSGAAMRHMVSSLRALEAVNGELDMIKAVMLLLTCVDSRDEARALVRMAEGCKPEAVQWVLEQLLRGMQQQDGRTAAPQAGGGGGGAALEEVLRDACLTGNRELTRQLLHSLLEEVAKPGTAPPLLRLLRAVCATAASQLSSEGPAGAAQLGNALGEAPAGVHARTPAGICTLEPRQVEAQVVPPLLQGLRYLRHTAGERAALAALQASRPLALRSPSCLHGHLQLLHELVLHAKLAAAGGAADGGGGDGDAAAAQRRIVMGEAPSGAGSGAVRPWEACWQAGALLDASWQLLPATASAAPDDALRFWQDVLQLLANMDARPQASVDATLRTSLVPARLLPRRSLLSAALQQRAAPQPPSCMAAALLAALAKQLRRCSALLAEHAEEPRPDGLWHLPGSFHLLQLASRLLSRRQLDGERQEPVWQELAQAWALLGSTVVDVVMACDDASVIRTLPQRLRRFPAPAASHLLHAGLAHAAAADCASADAKPKPGAGAAALRLLHLLAATPPQAAVPFQEQRADGGLSCGLRVLACAHAAAACGLPSLRTVMQAHSLLRQQLQQLQRWFAARRCGRESVDTQPRRRAEDAAAEAAVGLVLEAAAASAALLCVPSLLSPSSNASAPPSPPRQPQAASPQPPAAAAVGSGRRSSRLAGESLPRSILFQYVKPVPSPSTRTDPACLGAASPPPPRRSKAAASSPLLAELGRLTRIHVSELASASDWAGLAQLLAASLQLLRQAFAAMQAGRAAGAFGRGDGAAAAALARIWPPQVRLASVLRAVKCFCPGVGFSTWNAMQRALDRAPALASSLLLLIGMLPPALLPSRTGEAAAEQGWIPLWLAAALKDARAPGSEADPQTAVPEQPGCADCECLPASAGPRPDPGCCVALQAAGQAVLLAQMSLVRQLVAWEAQPRRQEAGRDKRGDGELLQLLQPVMLAVLRHWPCSSGSGRGRASLPQPPAAAAAAAAAEAGSCWAAWSAKLGCGAEAEEPGETQWLVEEQAAQAGVCDLMHAVLRQGTAEDGLELGACLVGLIVRQQEAELGMPSGNPSWAPGPLCTYLKRSWLVEAAAPPHVQRAAVASALGFISSCAAAASGSARAATSAPVEPAAGTPCSLDEGIAAGATAGTLARDSAGDSAATPLQVPVIQAACDLLLALHLELSNTGAATGGGSGGGTGDGASEQPASPPRSCAAAAPDDSRKPAARLCSDSVLRRAVGVAAQLLQLARRACSAAAKAAAAADADALLMEVVAAHELSQGLCRLFEDHASKLLAVLPPQLHLQCQHCVEGFVTEYHALMLKLVAPPPQRPHTPAPAQTPATPSAVAATTPRGGGRPDEMFTPAPVLPAPAGRAAPLPRGAGACSGEQRSLQRSLAEAMSRVQALTPGVDSLQRGSRRPEEIDAPRAPLPIDLLGQPPESRDPEAASPPGRTAAPGMAAGSSALCGKPGWEREEEMVVDTLFDDWMRPQPEEEASPPSPQSLPPDHGTRQHHRGEPHAGCGGAQQPVRRVLPMRMQCGMDKLPLQQHPPAKHSGSSSSDLEPLGSTCCSTAGGAAAARMMACGTPFSEGWRERLAGASAPLHWRLKQPSVRSHRDDGTAMAGVLFPSAASPSTHSCPAQQRRGNAANRTGVSRRKKAEWTPAPVFGGARRRDSSSCGSRAAKRRRRADAQLPPQPGSARSNNAFVQAALSEEGGRARGYSDLEDFIVCNPETDYDLLFSRRFRYSRTAKEDAIERGADAHRGAQPASGSSDDGSAGEGM